VSKRMSIRARAKVRIKTKVRIKIRVNLWQKRRSERKISKN